MEKAERTEGIMQTDKINYGFIEKWLRTALDLTIDNVSDDLKISKGNLSEMENGKRKMKMEQFRRFTEFYRIGFDLSGETRQEVSALLDGLVDCLFLGLENESMADMLLLQVRESRARYSRSTGCLYLNAIDALESLYLKRQTKTGTAFKEFSRMMDCYEDDIQSLFFLILGIRAKDLHEPEAAVSFLNRALAVHSGERWPQLRGVIRMQLGQTLTAFVSFDQGLEMTRLARTQFYQYGNLRMAVYCRFDEVLELICLQAYDSALHILEELRQNRILFNTPKAEETIISLHILILVFKEDFKTAGKLLELCSRTDVSVPEVLFVRPYVHYRLNQKDMALQTLEELKPFANLPEQKTYLELISQILLDQPDKAERIKNRLLRNLAKRYRWCRMMLICQMMIHYYHSHRSSLSSDCHSVGTSSKANRHPRTESIKTSGAVVFDRPEPDRPEVRDRNRFAQPDEIEFLRRLVEMYEIYVNLLHHRRP